MQFAAPEKKKASSIASARAIKSTATFDANVDPWSLDTAWSTETFMRLVTAV